MYWQKRKDRSGKIYYSFIQWDPVNRKNIRLRASEVPADITTDAGADEFCRVRDAEHEATRFRIERKLVWQKKFYDFEKLQKIFESEIKKRAPNSWRQVLYFLKQYVFDFFLNHKQSNNLNNWYLYFEEFRDWLEQAQPSQQTKTGQLSYSSKNHAISTLNTFLDVMHRKGKMEMAPKCQKFASHLIGRRTVDDVLSDEEIDVIHARLRELDPTELAADFFLVLVNTGLRLGEGLGISMADFFPDELRDDKLARALKMCDVKSIGYISLESQLKDGGKPRGSDGTVRRKPLKGRRKIEPGLGRIVPLVSRRVFNILAKRWNQQRELLEAKKHGKEPSDYLLFDGLTNASYSRILVAAYTGTRFRHKSPHCARHTFATNFAGLVCGNPLICAMVLGHKDQETTMGYIHLYEAINRKARSQELRREPIKIIAEG